MQYKHGKNGKSLGYNHKPNCLPDCTYLFEREVVLFNTYFRIKKNRNLLKPSAECIECYCIDLDLSVW